MAQKRNLPSKAFDINGRWTALTPVEGWRHYRISGRKMVTDEKTGKKDLFVEMMAVCDRSVRFWLERRAIISEENWQTGWIDGPP